MTGCSLRRLPNEEAGNRLDRRESLKDMDDIVTFFPNRNIPLAINHCVSIYPSEDPELEINQIDFLRNRFPNNTIGFSTHEYSDWTYSC